MEPTTTNPITLRLTEVRKSFGAVRALKGVTFEVRAGEVHALLGENGAGKSTLMAVAAGSLQPDEGTVEIAGETLKTASPGAAQALGLGVVYQHPALAEDLTVVENMRVAMPRKLRPSFRQAPAWAREALATIGAEKIDVGSRIADLTAAETQLVEIAKALALDPRVLVLDEPTAALESEEVDHLFEQVRAIRARGTAVVYISHRIPEVEAIADRLTVLRDGATRGTFRIDEVDEAKILELIAGRELEAVFPDKLGAAGPGAPVLSVKVLSGTNFDDISLDIAEGEIVGVAGVAGNGQREFVRALAGLGHHTGTITVNGTEVNLRNARRAQRDGVFYVSSDRRREGIFPALSVRENAVASSLQSFTEFGLVGSRAEREALAGQERELAIKTASQEADIASLSGGNQQKVVFARAMLGRPKVLICDEPTQGVDVGARVEIYRLLRELAADGCAVLVCSSDALELVGLCDRVMVMSRGQTVAVLEDESVTESKITGTAVTATTERKARAKKEERASIGRLGRFLRGDGVAAPVLALVILALAIFTQAQNDSFLTSFNVENLLLLSTALIFVALGQLVVLLTAGVDLSVGPMMGLGLVILTGFATDGKGTSGFIIGLGLAIVAGIGIGLINGGLVQFAKINPVIATLATFIGVQGIALLINPIPTGLFAASATETLSKTVAGIPIMFIICVVLAILAELTLRRGRLGLALRAVGSNEAAAHRMGVNVGLTRISAYVIAGTFAALAAMMLAVQIGTGDATAGQSYTLQSISAVVLGGASIYGGRGSFLGAVLGALLLTEMINAITFLELGEAWQYWFPGAVILIAAAIFARVSRIRLAAAAEAETA
ncbi:MAG: ATP-binding cassette domain-containing protein [Actinobacteria bacterium]|nr:ATP-binding cassette domain-containing protein [Actinomycetota bacterium]